MTTPDSVKEKNRRARYRGSKLRLISFALMMPVGVILTMLVVAYLASQERGDFTGAVAINGLLLTLYVAARSEWRRRRALARAAAYRAEETSSDTPLAVGAPVVTGRVAYARKRTDAVRVEIRQRGHEQEIGKGQWRHRWEETARHTFAQPFYLVRADGTRVRVEADERTVDLFDDLEPEPMNLPPVPDVAPERVRVAKLDVDETTSVVGHLELGLDPEGGLETATSADYRTAPEQRGWVLVPNPRLLVSTMPLGAHFEERAALHGRIARLALGCALLPLVLDLRWLDRGLLGTDVQAKVVQIVPERGKSGTLSGWHVVAEVDGRQWTSESTVHEPKDESTIALRVGPLTSNDGAGFRWTEGEAMYAAVCGVVVAVVLVWLRARALRSLPWFRRREGFVEHGEGRLPV